MRLLIKARALLRNAAAASREQQQYFSEHTGPACQLMGTPGLHESAPRGLRGWRPRLPVFISFLGFASTGQKSPSLRKFQNPLCCGRSVGLFGMPSAWVSCFGEPEEAVI